MKLAQGFAPMRRQGLRLLVGGQVASNLGDSFYAIALPWYVLAERGGPLLLGTVLAAYGVPRTVLLLVGGHASDRWRPWTVMMAADAVRAAAVGVLAIGAASGPPNAALLVPVALVLGAGEGMFLPGSLAIIPALVPASELQASNSLSSSLTQVATLVGPAVGGAIVALVGPSLAFATDAASFVVSATTLAGIRTRSGAHTSEALAEEPDLGRELGLEPGAAAGQDETAGGGELPSLAPAMASKSVWGMLKSERPLQVIFLVVLAANLTSGGLGEVALPALTHGPFHGSSVAYGALLAVLAGGGLFGTLLSGQVRPFSRPAVLASFVFLGEAALVAAIPYTGSVLAAAPLLAGFGLANGFGNVVMLTVFQRWAPPEALGRLMGLVMLAVFGTFPVSVAVGGLVVHRFGATPFFPAAGAVIALSLLAALTQREWRDFGSTRDRTTSVQDAIPAPLTSVAGASLAPVAPMKEEP